MDTPPFSDLDEYAEWDAPRVAAFRRLIGELGDDLVAQIDAAGYNFHSLPEDHPWHGRAFILIKQPDVPPLSCDDGDCPICRDSITPEEA